MVNLKHSNYKNESIEAKYLNNVRKDRFLKVKNCLFQWENDFIELKGREIKDIEIKIKSEIEELFSKPMIVSIDDMGKFEQNEMKKKRPVEQTWYDCLINYIPGPIAKNVSSFKDKNVSLFKANMPDACGK